MKINSKLFMSIALAIVILAIYGRVWTFDFVNYDDNSYVFQNPFVKEGLTVDSIRWALTSTENSLWIPVVRLSYLFESSLFGINASWYHIDNLIIHIVNSILIFLILSRLTGTFWRSAFAVFFFAVHPLRVESVVWITERKDVLSLFFLLLSLWSYFKFTISRNKHFYILSIGLFILSLASKPMTVSFPVLLILIDFWPLGRFRKKGRDNSASVIFLEKIPFFILSLLITVITVSANKTALRPNDIIPLSLRLKNIPVSLAIYLEKFFYPHDLTFFYPFNLDSLRLEGILHLVVLIIILTTLSFLAIKKFPYFTFGWLWFLAGLLPVSGIFQAGTQSMADRFTYIPGIGIAVIISWGAHILTERLKFRIILLPIAAAVVIVWLSTVSYIQVGTWKDSETLFNHALAVTENNEIAEVNLAGTYFQAGDLDRAVKHYRETLRINPHNGAAHFNLGNILLKKGDYQNAVNEYYSALETIKANPYLYRNLASALVKLGRNKEAEKQLNEYQRLKSFMGDMSR